MAVRTSFNDAGRVSIEVERDELHHVLSYLAHAKFSDEIKDYVLLSPLINELFRSIIEFSDKHGLEQSGSQTWRRMISDEEAVSPHSFVAQVKTVLRREYPEDGLHNVLSDALYPYMVQE
jgi:hypothetical protein